MHQDASCPAVTGDRCEFKTEIDYLINSEETRLKLIDEQVPFGYHSLDGEGRFLAVSRVWLGTMGYSRQEVIGRPFGQFLHPDHLDLFRDRFARFKETGHVRGAVFDMIRKDGSVVTARFHGEIEFDQKGGFKKTHCFFEDITYRKRMEKALTDSERYYRALIDGIREDILVIDSEYRIRDVNHNLLTTTGQRRQDLIGRSCHEVLHGNSKPCVKSGKACGLRKVFETGEPWKYRHEHIGSDGSSYWVDILLSPLRGNRGTIDRVIMASRDVTDLVQAEDALRESEETYRNILESLVDVYYRTDSDGTITLVSPSGPPLLGFDGMDDLVGKNLADEFYYRPEERGQFLKELSRKGEVKNYEVTLKRKDGTPIIGETSSRLVYDRSGTPVGVEGILRDCTERKKAEEKIRTQRKELISIFDSIDEPIYVADPENYELLYANAVTKKAFGRDIIGKKCYKVLQDLDRPCEFCTNQKILGENAGKSHVWEFQNIRNMRWYHCIDKAIGWPDGRTVRYELAVDINDQKQSEEALKNSENLYRTLAENVGDGVLICQDNQPIFANRALYSILGYALGELSRINLKYLISEDHDNHAAGAGKSSCKGTRVTSFQTACIRKDGQKIWVGGRRNTIEWQGKPAVLVTIRDITEDKLREIALTEERERLKRQNIELRAKMKDRYKFENIIGMSPAMQQVYEFVMKAADSDSNIIIYGESGTGKELVARTIHDLSARADRPFVAVNCGAVPETVFESEFFGFRKGAFTGAHADKYGFFDSAHGGTLFLDEIGELTLNMQAKLLRAIEGGGYVRLGDSRPKRADARIITATNRDLAEMVRRGSFREDFFYRLHVIPIHLPPLRKRKEDIPLLVDHFLAQWSVDKKHPVLPSHIMDALITHDWPGNVRELQNLLQRYVNFKNIDFVSPRSADTTLKDKALSPDIQSTETQGLRECLQAYEKGLIIKVLEENRWHRGKAARKLDIPERTLYRKMKQLSLQSA